jgi:sigma-B regulation protein RsbU (phosphoserine phosphatase)
MPAEPRLHALVADDDRVTATVLAASLRRWNFDVSMAHNGEDAWRLICGATTTPSLAILDWMMPGLDGVALCSRIRERSECSHMYVILLTSRDSSADIVVGLEAGADEYLVKPFDPNELRARVQTGKRVLSLQNRLVDKIAALEEALANVKQLRGLLPMCSYCKSIRNDGDYWQQLEGYIADHSDAEFSHGICPTCLVRVQAEYEA